MDIANLGGQPRYLPCHTNSGRSVRGSLAWPPMEAGLAADEIAVVGESDAAFGDHGVEFGEALEVPVDDRLVDMDPRRVSAG